MDEPTLYTSPRYLVQNPTWHQEDSLWKANKILRMLQLQKLSVNSIVEVGCGAGDVLFHLSRALPSTITLTGYDISPHAIHLCQSKRNERLSFEVKDFVNNETPGFDLLLAIDVIEHVPDYLTFLRKLRTKAKYKLFHIPLDLGCFRTDLHTLSPSQTEPSRPPSLFHERNSVGHAY